MSTLPFLHKQFFTVGASVSSYLGDAFLSDESRVHPTTATERAVVDMLIDWSLDDCVRPEEVARRIICRVLGKEMG